MNKRKLKIVCIIAVGVAILGLIVFFIIKKINSVPTNNNITNEVNQSNVEVTGKLLNYIDKLKDNYYIKYSGSFKDNSGEYKQAIVEYTKLNDKFAIKSAELDMNVVYDGKNINSVSDKYNIIVKMVQTAFNLNEYHLVQNIGQTYVKSYKDYISGKLYDVEEYKLYDNTYKYYFKENDLKMIEYNGKTIKILRVENDTNAEMLVLPEGYKIMIT